MRKLLSVLIVSTVMLSGVMDTNACGDKTLGVGRGIRFQRFQQSFAARHPSTVLIHTPAIPAAKAPQLKDYLIKIGHKPHIVEHFSDLGEALKSGQYDLVLIDLPDAGNLQRQIESFGSKAVVVPVVYNRTKAEKAAAARQYKVVVKNPTNGDDFVAAVYEVMKSKAPQNQRKS